MDDEIADRSPADVNIAARLGSGSKYIFLFEVPSIINTYNDDLHSFDGAYSAALP